jgi:hypothetical protein
MNGDVFYRRDLTSFEEGVLNYLKAHPGLTTYDVAEQFGHTEATYYAVPYLVWNLYADQDSQTHAITVRDI